MIARTKKYIQDIKLEWGKVSKPQWKDVQGNTIVVIVACAIIGIFLWLVDGNTTYPKWLSIHGMILLVGIVLVAPLIVKRYTPRWQLTIPIALIPLIVVLCYHFVFNSPEPIRGFGLSLLRSWFIQTN
ncbi:MAG: preprotein translocase subunit SecE [Candidatus Poribacteria bacterium]|nr:preprotein translocase subunit SecE [Candidatus Poribacteria bacterium]